MKKKKFIFGGILLLLFLIIINYNTDLIYAATTDNEPPRLISFTIDNSNAIPGEYIYLNINAEDDVSGLDSGSIGLYNPIKGYIVYQIDIDNLNNPRILIPSDAIGGLYTISHLTLKDKNHNMITYYNEKLFYNEGSSTFDFGENTIKIIDESSFEDDYDAPVVSNVTVDKQRISLGEQVKVCAKVTDESEISHVSCNLKLKENENNFALVLLVK